MMPVWMGRSTQIGSDDLKNCVNLIKAVSDRANKHDLARATVLKEITDRGGDNSWYIWYHKNGGGIDACCFFQLMRSQNSGYAMCIGFDKTAYPMQSDSQCSSFITTMAGSGSGDRFLRDSILNVLNVNFVYLVDMDETPQAAQYSQARDNLFHYMQQKSSGTGWTLTQVIPNSGFRADFWGGDTDVNGNVIGLTLWRLGVS
jgi:hypothetical protein